MPIDTRNKRSSVPQHVVTMVMRTPSGTIGVASREHATWLYEGITPQAPVQNSGTVIRDLYATFS